MKKNVRLLVAITALIFASLACQVLQPVTVATPQVAIPTVAVPTAAPVVVASESLSQQDTLISIYRKVSPGIVAIQVLTDQGGSLGTGFVFDDQGHIVTNYHVVEGEKKIEVDFTSGYKAYGKVVGTDLDSDLAVIKVDAPASEIHPLLLGDSSQLQVGQSVVAIGNPFGLSGTMTLGIVSALGRSLPSNRESPGGGFFSAGDLIQTDASINPGNSGGPLLNLSGEVVGINRAIRTDASNTTGEPVNSGIGFSIAINIVKRVVPVIIANGKYDYPYMGLGSASDLSLDEITALGLPQFTGAYVTNVTPGGPAEIAGLVAGTKDVGLQGNLFGGGDLIIAMDGNSIKNFDDLIGYLVDNKSPGDTVLLTIIRDGNKIDLPLVLVSRP
ncbi:MAG: trypsin-like peptidase domain-containing protein [Chloroflexi bacterium]|nr:trypsin-like peptidase domain-containing protein [Chloroflexota bacterium]